MASSRRLLAGLIGLVLVAAGCTAAGSPQDAATRQVPPDAADHDAQSDTAASVPVTPQDGASLTLGAITVQVPPDAVSTEGTLHVEVVDRDLDVPSGLSWHAPPVEVRLEGTELIGSSTIHTQRSATADTGELLPLGVFVSSEGALEVRDTRVEGGVVAFDTDHFSRFGFVSIDVAALGARIVEPLVASLTGRAGAAAPRCEGEDRARQLAEPSSDSGDLVRWCWGTLEGEPVLEVVNNRSAAVALTHPSSWAASVPADQSVTLQRLGGLLSQARPMPADRVVLLVPAGATARLQPPAAAPGGTVSLQMDLLVWATSGLDLAVEVWLGLLRQLGVTQVGSEELVSALEVQALLTCFLDVFGEDIGVGDGTPSAGELAKVGRFAATCGFEAILDFLEDQGLNLLARTVLGAVAAAVGLVASGAQTALAGTRNLVDHFTGDADYRISLVEVERSEPTSQAEVAAAFYAAFLARDAEQARRFTLPGQSPDAYDHLLATWSGPEVQDLLLTTPRCQPESIYCDFTTGVDPTDLLVVEQRDGRWMVTGAGLGLVGPSAWRGPEGLERFCVEDTTPLNLRTGPGTSFPAMTAIPIDDCDVFGTDYLVDGWRPVFWNDRVGLVADSRLRPADGPVGSPGSTDGATAESADGLAGSPPRAGCETFYLGWVADPLPGEELGSLALISRDPSAASGYAHPGIAPDLRVVVPTGTGTGQAALDLLAAWAEQADPWGEPLVWVCGHPTNVDLIVGAGPDAPQPAVVTGG